MLTAEQIIAAQKSNLDTLFGMTAKAFEGVEKLVELNLQVAKTAMGEAAESTQAALSAKDAQELLALQTSLLQPAAEKAAAYSRHLYDIAAATTSEITKAAEATAAEAQKKLGWSATLARLPDDRVAVRFAGAPDGLVVSAVARHPLGRAPDQALSFERAADGAFVSTKPVARGRWMVRIAAQAGPASWREEQELR